MGKSGSNPWSISDFPSPLPLLWVEGILVDGSVVLPGEACANAKFIFLELTPVCLRAAGDGFFLSGGCPLLLACVDGPASWEVPRMIGVSEGWTAGGSIAVLAAVVAVMMLAAASSISPLASLWRILCRLAALSMGSGQFLYWMVTSCRSLITSSVVGMRGYSLSSMTKSRNKGETVGEKYSCIEFLQGRTPASGSPLGDAPGLRWETFRVRFQGQSHSSEKWKYSDKGILPYFWI